MMTTDDSSPTSHTPDEPDDRDEPDEKTYTIVCSLCGSNAQLPFKPRKDEAVFCQDCFKYKRNEVNRDRQRRSPRKQHGTRVMFPITCAQCGQEETLDYVPKGVALDEALCSECVRKTHGEESRWAKVTDQKQAEKRGEWAFECATCGREDYLKFSPKPDKDYYCVRCFNEQASPSQERLDGKKKVGRAVYVRSADDSAAGDDDNVVDANLRDDDS